MTYSYLQISLDTVHGSNLALGDESIPRATRSVQCNSQLVIAVIMVLFAYLVPDKCIPPIDDVPKTCRIIILKHDAAMGQLMWGSHALIIGVVCINAASNVRRSCSELGRPFFPQLEGSLLLNKIWE